LATIVLNGDSREVPDGLSVAGLLRHLGVETDRVAVERNLGIVKKKDWESVTVHPGDTLEVVTFVGGGVCGFDRDRDPDRDRI
jgi:thiamine biosynthesis protein ThiS